jgi:hypothetical protein
MRLQTALTYSKKINRFDTENDVEGKDLAVFLGKTKTGIKTIQGGYRQL